MDDAVNTRCAAFVALLCLSANAFAQELGDPTRPPARLTQAAAGAALDSAPRLQSVLIGLGPDARRVAVIDGDTVRLGQVWQGARVASITADSVVLVRGRQRQVLRLAAPEPAMPTPEGVRNK